MRWAAVGDDADVHRSAATAHRPCMQRRWRRPQGLRQWRPGGLAGNSTLQLQQACGRASSAGPRAAACMHRQRRTSRAVCKVAEWPRGGRAAASTAPVQPVNTTGHRGACDWHIEIGRKGARQTRYPAEQSQVCRIRHGMHMALHPCGCVCPSFRHPRCFTQPDTCPGGIRKLRRCPAQLLTWQILCSAHQPAAALKRASGPICRQRVSVAVCWRAGPIGQLSTCHVPTEPSRMR